MNMITSKVDIPFEMILACGFGRLDVPAKIC